MSFVENITNAIKIQIKSLMPVSLDKECEKAAETTKGFIFNDNMEVKNPIISPTTIKNAKGLVILTIGKAGISFTIRGGSGVLITRLPDGTWSAPSAVKTGGFGIGSQFGAEIIELVMVLTNDEAIKNFRELENITLGGNISAAIGSLGISAEASSTLKNASAIISYGKSKGVYVGASVEGAVIQQNSDANALVYGKDVKSEDILTGKVEKPEFAKSLYDILAKCEQTTKNSIEAKPDEKKIEDSSDINNLNKEEPSENRKTV
ncbi:DUF500-domain-containing protein [Piromyces finnis]|uniref:DUF500-domain-containing protein n=1 Tax=Piromyces finnis TaxID=1754191 RepID=A0A1Y1V2W3_9FUNG|nr:DUF500-domain-containing protein [Piromyces finnis]|eukprot:ORX45386.1 DUF500-domain-containing protein [Piromyces finnis]